jgi:hypothetical protein
MSMLRLLSLLSMKSQTEAEERGESSMPRPETSHHKEFPSLSCNSKPVV